MHCSAVRRGFAGSGPVSGLHDFVAWVRIVAGPKLFRLSFLPTMLPEYATVVLYSTIDRHSFFCRDQ